jgi:hypothetical protein
VSFKSVDSAQINNEADVKAAFIINFTKYIEWNNSDLENSSVFKIGVLGDTPIYESLKELSSKKVKNKHIEVVYFQNASALQECHLLYVSSNMTLSDLKSSSNSSKCKNTLVIGDKKDALVNGASINFIAVGDQLKFEINLQNINKNQLKVSSQLLQLATNVHE